MSDGDTVSIKMETVQHLNGQDGLEEKLLQDLQHPGHQETSLVALDTALQEVQEDIADLVKAKEDIADLVKAKNEIETLVEAKTDTENEEPHHENHNGLEYDSKDEPNSVKPETLPHLENVQDNLKEELLQDVQDNLKEEVVQDVQDNLKEDLVKDVEDNLKEKLLQDVQDNLKEELLQDVQHLGHQKTSLVAQDIGLHEVKEDIADLVKAKDEIETPVEAKTDIGDEEPHPEHNGLLQDDLKDELKDVGHPVAISVAEVIAVEKAKAVPEVKARVPAAEAKVATDITLGTDVAEEPEEEGPILKSVICAVSICLGSFLLGTSIGYPSPAIPNLNDHRNPFHVSDEQSSWVGSIVPLGALVGGLLGGAFSDWIGRKLALLWTSLFYAIGWVIIVSSPNFGCLVAGRTISGLSTGLVSVTCPVYLGEISPASIRGQLGSLHQTLVCIGILFTYGFGVFLDWTWLGIACQAWSLVLVVVVIWIPESPRWLLSVKRREEAEVALRWLRGPDFKVEKAIAQLEKVIKKSEDKASLMEFLQPQLYKPLLICIGLMLFQQFSGINVIMFYTVDIFQKAKLDMDPNVETVIVGAVGLVGTVGSVLIIDKTGRRILLAISGAMMTLTIAGMGAYFYELDHNPDTAANKLSWLPVTCLVIFNFGYNVAFGAVPWVMMSELFPQRARGLASSMCSALNWLFGFLLTKFWVNMTDSMSIAGGYWFCTAFCFLSLPFTLFVVPETKGRTLEEIAASFK